MDRRSPGSDLSAIHADVVPSFSRDYDQTARVACIRSFAICSTPRSGSTLLCQGLWDLGNAGRPAEYFNERHVAGLLRRWRCHTLRSRLALGRRATRRGLLLASAATLRRYVRELLARRSTDNGVFGVKLHHSQHERELGGLALSAILPAPRLVLVTRDDRPRQAVSLLRAQQSNRYRHTDPAAGPERFDPAGLAACLDEIARETAGWERDFAQQGAEPLRVTYEQLVADYEGTVRRVARFVGAEPPAAHRLPAPRLRRQADAVSEEWLARWEGTPGGPGAAGPPAAGR